MCRLNMLNYICSVELFDICSTFFIVKGMKTNVVTLSNKYQIVIPKDAREKMGLNKPDGQHFRVKSVSENEIVFVKNKSLEDFLGKYSDVFPKNATSEIRRLRNNEWE